MSNNQIVVDETLIMPSVGQRDNIIPTGESLISIKCEHKNMSRGTTPSYAFKLAVPFIGKEKFFITFRQHNKIILEKENHQIQRMKNNIIKIKFSQQETLLFSSKFPIEAQIRTLYADGAATASEFVTLFLDDIIKQGVISNG